MKNVNEMYGKGFFSRRYKLSWRAPHVINAIEKTFNLNPENYIRYLDVGCAVGDLVAEALKRGYDAYGLEGSEYAFDYLECSHERVTFVDLRKRMDHRRLTKFHLLSCFEVAEHIEEEYADIFVDNLCRLSNWILMSAAPPGQKGHHHYNCQPYEYWDEKFERKEYTKVPELESKFRHLLAPWKKKDGIKAFYNNCLVYRKYHGRI